MTMLEDVVAEIRSQKERKGSSLPGLKSALKVEAAKNVSFVLSFVCCGQITVCKF